MGGANLARIEATPPVCHFSSLTRLSSLGRTKKKKSTTPELFLSRPRTFVRQNVRKKGARGTATNCRSSQPLYSGDLSPISHIEADGRHTQSGIRNYRGSWKTYGQDFFFWLSYLFISFFLSLSTFELVTSKRGEKKPIQQTKLWRAFGRNPLLASRERRGTARDSVRCKQSCRPCAQPRLMESLDRSI